MSDRYRNPAVERTMEILRCLEGRVQGANLNELAAPDGRGALDCLSKS